MTYRQFQVACIFFLTVCGSSRQGIPADAAASPFVYVCRDAGAGGYQAFPDVCQLQDGRLMAAFYASYTHVGLPNAQWPKGGRISFCTSSDEGHTWSKAETLYDGPNDDRDPSLVQLKNGRLICNFFILTKEVKPGQPRVSGLTQLGTWIITSDNLGKTWSKPRQVYGQYLCSSPIRELSDGRLVMPLYRETPEISAGAVGVSDDGGKTWSKPVDIDNNGYRLDAETDVIELANGRLWATQRASHAPLCYATSADKGNTWTKSKPLTFVGHSPYLHRANDNIILLGYRGYHSLDGSGQGFTALRYSLDECTTWSDPVTVDASCVGAYPSMVNLKDASVLIVYYEEGAKSSIRAKRFRATRSGIEWLVP